MMRARRGGRRRAGGRVAAVRVDAEGARRALLLAVLEDLRAADQRQGLPLVLQRHDRGLLHLASDAPQCVYIRGALDHVHLCQRCFQ